MYLGKGRRQQLKDGSRAGRADRDGDVRAADDAVGELREVLLFENHWLVSPIQLVSETCVIGLVELLLGLKDPVLIDIIYEAVDVVILELTELVAPLGQGKVDELAFGRVLHGNGSELDG